MKSYLIAGNWKMNLTAKEAKKFASDLAVNIKNTAKGIEVMIAPPFTALESVREALKGSIIKLGAQNVNENEKGAFTGEISCAMLLDLGVEYVIIGHSERRHIYKESNELINKKVLTALKNSLKPILCVGELIEEKESGRTNEIVKEQLIKGLKDVSPDNIGKIVIAYEPVWAIGTGKVATPEIAEEVHLFIRNTLTGLYDKNISDSMIIQYGGSVNDENAAGLMAKDNINGALVGGASLKLDSFIKIVNFKK
jgi:triosephosphate isomerase